MELTTDEFLAIEGVVFSLVICKSCGHKAKEFDLLIKLPLPEKIILKCSKCNYKKNIVGVWRGNRLAFTEKGIDKEVLANLVASQLQSDQEHEWQREKNEAEWELEEQALEHRQHTYFDSRSPLEWDDDEEEWTSF